MLDLNIYIWYKQNAIYLNLNKCTSFTFSLKIMLIQLINSLSNLHLFKVSTIYNLVVKFDFKLSFDTLFIRNKTYFKLGFLKPTYQNFSN